MIAATPVLDAGIPLIVRTVLFGLFGLRLFQGFGDSVFQGYICVRTPGHVLKLRL